MPKRTMLTLTALLILVVLQGFSQHSRINADSIRNTLLPGESKYVVETFVGDSVTSRQLLDSKNDSNATEERYIVRFKASPLMGTRLKSSANAADLENEHTRFMKDFSELLSQSGMNRLKSSGSLVQREFKSLINGVAVTMPANVAEQVKKLGYVTRVEKDEIVRVNDEPSNQAIEVPRVWNELGYTGKGVVIAIVDTGVDTAHACFSGNKFVKGYDFANNDDDPFDDHSHGTHCAGIAAANADQIKGVAPDAKIMPIKVLGKDGYGRNSDIIAGIEFAVDPDHNPDTKDGANVLSLSLGGYGYPDDAQSAAIDNAVGQGAVCVVAAGNAGSSSYTILSPGCARKALTVGSCNSSGITSWFSSRGPAQITQAVKPEVSAPGEGIYSSTPGNNYQNLSGTSMATPHVAGIAALLIQKNPAWDPENIKSSIIQSAHRVSGKVLEEGFGMVNAYNALQNDLVIAPYVLDLGVVDDNHGIITIVKEIQVTNTTTTVKDISILEGEKKVGFNVSVSFSSFPLNPGESKMITVNCTFDPITLNIQDQIPMLYKELIVKEGGNANRIPVVGLIGKTIQLVFETRPDICTVFNADWNSSFNIPLDINQTIVLGKAKTDLLVSFDNFNRYVLKENLESGRDTILISPKDAKNEIHVKADSPMGSRLNLFDGINEEIRKKNGDKYSGMRLLRITAIADTHLDLPDIRKYFSDISDNYVYENSFIAYPSFNPGINQIIKVPFGLNQGINASKNITITSRDYKKIHLQFELDNYSDILYYTFGLPLSSIIYWDPFIYRTQAIKAPYQADFYLLPDPYEEYNLAKAIQIIFWKKNFDFDYSNLSKFIPAFTTGNISVNSKGKILCSPNSRAYMDTNIFEIMDGNFECNENLKTLDYIQVNMGDMIILKYPGAILFGHNVETYNDTVYLKIKHTNGEVIRDTIYSQQSYVNQFGDFYEAKVGSNDSISISSSYPFDKSVSATSLFEFQTRCQFTELFRFPIQIVLKGNAVQNKYLLPGLNSISFKGMGTMKLWIREMKQKDWLEIPVKLEKEDQDSLNTYSAIIPALLKKGYYDLKVKQINNPNTPNELQTISKWLPAFYVCNDTEADSLCLVNFYKSTGGQKWINHSGWLKEKISNWYGITMENGRVVSVKLNGNNLQGNITKDIRKLSKLTTIDLSNNKLTAIPDLTGIQGLKELNVQKNKLDFSSIIPNQSIATFNFIQQDSLNLYARNQLMVSDSILFDIIGNYPGNQYKWFNKDQLVYESDLSNYNLVAHSPDESGIYFCKVYNKAIADFYIPTKKVKVKILEKIFESLPDQFIETNNPGITSTNWVDIDNDGDEDLFIGNKGYHKSNLLINTINKTGAASFEAARSEGLFGDSLSVSSSSFGDYNNDGLEDLALFSDQAGIGLQLFENRGNLNFNKKQIEVSVNNTPLEILQGSSWVDLNHDNYLDLVFGYYEDAPNEGGNNRGIKLLNNKGNFNSDGINCIAYCGTLLFSDILKEKGTELIRSFGQLEILKENINGGMNRCSLEKLYAAPQNNLLKPNISTLGDFDNDSDLDIFCPIHNPIFSTFNSSNMFLENTPNTFLIRLNLSPVIKAIESTSGSVCFDYDNDGDLDLAVSNMGAANELYRNLWMETGRLAFEPLMDDVFENKTGNWIGISASDMDLDGYMDLTEVSSSGVYLLKNLYRGNNWLSVKCKGTVSNGSALGAKVYAIATINGKKVTQYREILAASGETSVTSKQLHFGLGNASKVDSLIIKWPSGNNNLLKNVEINKFMEITESLDQIPVANAGSDQTVKAGERVTLDGSASSDPNGEHLLYKWNAPPEIILSNPNVANPTFLAPVIQYDKSYLLTLIVTNGVNDSPVDQLQVYVFGNKYAPSANAGMDQIVNEGDTVTLDGTASSDADMNQLTYLWTAPVGIMLNSQNAGKPSFTAPRVKNDSVLSFSLVVKDGLRSSSRATTKVTVLNVVRVGNAAMDAARFRIYPNPSDGYVSVETLDNAAEMITVSISDATGKEVWRKEISVEPKLKLDLSILEDGIYFLSLTDKNGQHISKIVVRK